MRRGRWGRLSPVLMLVATACAGAQSMESVSPAPAGVASTAALEAAYTEAQAVRGATAYADACSSCHADDLRGNSNAPSLVGVSFTFLWEGKSVAELLDVIRASMPTNAPGSLAAAEYNAILAYILRANGLPAGTSELGSDPAALDRILITAGSNPIAHLSRRSTP